MPKSNAFRAVSANSWNDFVNNRVNLQNVVEMGLNCPRHARGNYYLQTNLKAPFARDLHGITHVNQTKMSKFVSEFKHLTKDSWNKMKKVF